MEAENTPIFFPTRVAIIDDDADYLSNVPAYLDEHIDCQLFNSPRQALAELQEEREKSANFAEQCTEYVSTNLISDEPEYAKNSLYRFIDDKQRFNRYSVVVVDYDMPEMSGLELCKTINDPWIKKILVTGKVDERIAVQAFNEGVIDYFIRKDELDMGVRLNSTINSMLHRYFNEICFTTKPELKTRAPYLFDMGFNMRFNNLCREHNIVEFYLRHNVLIDEFIMVTDTGDLKCVLVQTSEQARDQFDIELNNKQNHTDSIKKQLSNPDIPDSVRNELQSEHTESLTVRDELLAAIEERQVIAYFAGNCEYDDSFKDNWRDHVYQATIYENYSYAFIDTDDLLHLDISNTFASYQHFLGSLNKTRLN